MLEKFIARYKNWFPFVDRDKYVRTLITDAKQLRKEECIQDLKYWRLNAEEDYRLVPLSVLRYISELEKAIGTEPKE